MQCSRMRFYLDQKQIEHWLDQRESSTELQRTLASCSGWSDRTLKSAREGLRACSGRSLSAWK